jgi:hypothetical protein
VRHGAAIALSAIVLVGATAGSADAASLTLVFDDVATMRFVDVPPAGASPGDTELAKGRLRDASGRFVGTADDKCVFTKAVPNDMLERCSGTAKTADGTATVAGVGHLNSMNPPWRITGRSGAYKGVRGTQVFATDIPLDPNFPFDGGRFFSVAVIRLKTDRHLHAGVVPRPAANARFIRRAARACRATQARADKQPPFPFSSFDPFHPDPSVLPQVGQFFNDPARRALPTGLLKTFEALGKPPASRGAWKRALTARRRLLGNESQQIQAALADDGPAFVKTVYQQSRDYNELVFRSAVFSDPPCTFG